MQNISCPHCQAQLLVEAEWNGQEVTCPTCSQPFAISLNSDVSQPHPADVQPSNVQQTNRTKRKNSLQQRTPNISNGSAQNTGGYAPTQNMYQNTGYSAEPGFTDVARRKMSNLVSTMIEKQDKAGEITILLSVISWFIFTNLYTLCRVIQKTFGYNYLEKEIIVFLLIATGILAGIGLFSAIVCKFKVRLYIAASLLASSILSLIVINF